MKVGILGGGQLGRMLAQASIPLPHDFYFLDQSLDFPVGRFWSKFVSGDFRKYDDVYAFGKEMDIITIEIESVNLEALRQLQKEGKIVHPDPSALAIIKDKGNQKNFYHENDIPTSNFQLCHSSEIHRLIKIGKIQFPFVQKLRTEGYDGRGVAVINNSGELNKILEGESLIEEKVNIQTELSVVTARNQNGEIKTFEPVEMTFHPKANLMDILLSPARIDYPVRTKAIELANSLIKKLNICGLLAVEMFLTNENDLLINEVAPRPHNSGHHTIENAFTSQFEQHLKAILNLPLGDTGEICPASMFNLLGANNIGPATYYQIEECLAIDRVYIHTYGKSISKPFRKMGHVTCLDKNLDEAIKKANLVRSLIKVDGK